MLFNISSPHLRTLNYTYLTELTFLQPFLVHVFWLSAIAVAYYFWAFLGHIVTGNYIYFFLDPEKIGEENVAVGLIAFVSLLNICESPISRMGQYNLTA